MILLKLDDLYVGELYLEENNDDIKNNKKAIYININYNKISYTDYKNDKKYYCYFVLFKKNSDNTYTCIQNNKTYTKNDNSSFYRNIKPLKQYLPKQDFTITKYVTPSYALFLFSSLFINNKHMVNDSLTQNIKHDKSNMFIGNLNLCVGSQTYENRDKVYNFISLPEKLLLDKNGSFQECISSGIVTIYDYYNYLCLFNKVDDKYLNYCDNQEYELEEKIGKSFITNLRPLDNAGTSTIKSAIIRLRKNK